MQVILKVDLKGTGKSGQLVSVADGYAKNYLLPRGLAVLADKKALGELQSKVDAAKHREELEKLNAEETAKRLEGRTVKVTARAGASGKLFGSVTSKEIASAIKEQFDVEIDKRKIHTAEDIKSFGGSEIEIKLYPGVAVKLWVIVGEAK